MNIFRTEEERDAYQTGYEAGYKASEEEFHAPLGTEPLPPQMLEALDITREAVAAQVESEALALVRELNDIVWGVIPSDLQARVDAILDRSEQFAARVSAKDKT